MEAQIDDALKSGDFYSAHQIILVSVPKKTKGTKDQ